MQSLLGLPDEEWIDCKAEFETALSELSIGQLVQDPRYTMMDLMSAIEINDPRTDSFVAARNNSGSQLPDFDASRQLSTEEIVWVLDKIMRLEATFQDGQPLMSTLWNCNYFRIPSLPALSSSCGDERIGSVQAVFRAMLLGILKSQEIVWEECCKGQVYEHEDVHLASSTLSFNSLMAACYPLPPRSRTPSPVPPSNPLLVNGQQAKTENVSQDRSVSIDDVLRLLDECSIWLQTETKAETEEEREALDQLILRVSLRIDLLYIQALLTFPAHATPSQIRNHLDRISTYVSGLPSSSSSSSSSSFHPSLYLQAIFAPSRSIPLLATSAPPRLIDPLPLGESYDKNVKDLIAELNGLCQLWEGWRKEEGEGKLGWKEVKEYSRMMARREVSPYLRSLHQTVLTSTPSHVFSTSHLIHFSASFLATLTSTPASFWFETVYAMRQSERDYAGPAHIACDWLERLAQELLRTTLPLAGQNRTRQFRWIRKSVSNWVKLVQNTKRDLEPFLSLIAAGEEEARVDIDNLVLAIRSTFVELIVENVGSGFEGGMELYRGEEWPRVWFVLGQVAQELEEMWTTLLSTSPGDVGYLKAKVGEARAIKEMSRGSFLMSIRLPAPSPKFSTPFLPTIAVNQETADRGRFRQRFDWIGSNSDETLIRSAITYEMYTRELQRVQALEPNASAREAEACYHQAVDALNLITSVSMTERAAAIRPEFPLRNLASLRRTAFANLDKLSSLNNETSQSPSQVSARNLKWDHSWFSIFT
ncbi:uncharacterized protein JCM6883_004977 [Sporobolomyces salmoneus]|uniref:uncharacterized protein n=1 Tax=Sporobolomyces salmoneus TaxID=183962 RepID=UPI00316EA9A6